MNERIVAIIFGAVLVAVLIYLIFYFFSPKRKDKVEHPKYVILEDYEKEAEKNKKKDEN